MTDLERYIEELIIPQGAMPGIRGRDDVATTAADGETDAAGILFRRQRGLPVPLFGPAFTRGGGGARSSVSVIGSDCRIPGAPAMRRVRGRGPAGARLAS